MELDELPENKPDPPNLYILDPLSVIIKLAIISNKPVGTKIRISSNIIYLQEPGPFQAFCRYIFKNNKTDMQYLYNPIEFACKTYLSKSSITQYPKLKDLFEGAQRGLSKLSQTYKNCSVIRICLNYYVSLIANYLESDKDKFNPELFRKDDMTHFYSTEIISTFSSVWTPDKIKIVLNLTTFLQHDNEAETNVRSLETIMEGIDSIVAPRISGFA